MIIDRDKHNKYVVGWKPNYTVPTNQGSSSGTNVTIVYGGGGSGSSTPVSSEAFSYYKVSDGENAITQEAKVQKDIANLSIIGDEGIKVELITDPTIFEASFTSTGTNKGVYKISYGKVTTVVEQPTESETQAEEPTEPEVVITFPMTITYVSGEKIKAEQFDTLRLLNNTEEVATYPSSSLAIEGDADGILSISLEVYKEVQSVDEEGKPVQDAEGNPVMEKQGLYFNRILLTSQLEDQPSTQAEGDSTEEEPQQPTYKSLLSFDVVVNIDTVIKLSSDSGAGLWKLDDNGNIYTEYNAYSLKELSAYGLGEGESGEGAGFLHELGDVSIPDPNAIPDNAILQYNIETGKWEAAELGELDDTATREWVEQKFKDLINGAPADLDTLGEIAIAIQELQQLLDWFSFVDGRIRANYNFWGVGEVSAYGPASGSDPGTGGGAGFLHELGDVTINNDTLANGQIIVWDEDSQMWVNVDFPGLDEDALALYLTQNKYATQEWVKSQLDPINNKLEEFQTTIDMINDMFEWDNGKIKAKATLYSVGEISAYGAGEGSSGTGGYLHELDDVLLTSLQDDQLLMYDATIEKWINVDKNSVGLNETELEQYLTTHNYVTSDQVVLPTRRIIAGTGLTGGGALSSDVTLSLATSGVTSGVYTKVTVDQYGRVTLGALLAENDIPNIAWSKIHSTPTTLAGYGITDAYTMQQSDERYVNVTGDTMTGNLILPTLQANTSIILGSVKLEYDSANKALKISHIDGSTAMNMYATGEVSAYGAGIGSAGGGKEYLHDLLDVLITELADNQLLMYDAEQQKWINIDKDQVGLNETELQNYLTTNQYTTQSWVNQQLEAQLSDKVDKEDGKGLSSNDFTDELLAKLNGITTGAQGTFTKVTTNSYGQVISGTTLSAADIPGLDWSKIISGKPTTLAGYGITDGVNAVSVTGTGNAVTTASISGHTLTLTKALSFALITGTNATGTWPISITGNAATASKWATARTITLAGSVTGSTSIDGSGNVTITTTYTTDNISALDGRYVNVTGDTMTGNLILPTLQANTSIILGSVKLEYDSASNALKISNVNTQQVINLYATGEISAYGYNSGSAGGGASTLNDLDDVTLSNLQNGQALVYNSSTGQWINTTIQAGGIDEAALAQYLTNNQYLTMPTGDGRYVKKAGDTMTGTLVINKSGGAGASPLIVGGSATNIALNDLTSMLQIVAGSGGATNSCGIGFHNPNISSAILGYYNTNSNNGYFNFKSDDTSWDVRINNNPILHAGNYTTYTVTKTGGGASGTWPINITGVSQGVGSYSYFTFNKNDNNGWPTFTLIADVTSTWNTTANGNHYGFVGIFSGTRINGYINESSGFLIARIGYSQTSRNLYTTNYTLAPYIVQYNGRQYIALRSTGSGHPFYLYGFRINLLSSFTQLNCTDSAGSLPGGLTILVSPGRFPINANVDSATSLQTARTIWGQSFDGTANVDGLFVQNYNNSWLSPSRLQIGRRDTTLYTDRAVIGITNGNLHLDAYQGYAIYLNHYQAGSSSSNSVIIDKNGNLGVGIIPSYKLQVNGISYINATPNSDTGIANFNRPGGGEAYIYLYSNGSPSGAFTSSQPSYGTAIFNYAARGYLGITNAGIPHYNGSKLWHQNNDGSGSGLDADLLDGLQASAFYNQGYVMFDQRIDASSLNVNTWYPVCFNIGAHANVRIECRVSLNSGTKPSWSTHTGGFSVRKIWEVNGSGWGTNAVNRRVLISDYSFADTDPVRGIGQNTKSSIEYVYVRGGGVYYFYLSHNVPATLYTNSFTSNNVTIGPTTTTPAAIVRNVAYVTDNVASATQLQTARSIWGQYFNGTANISGNMSGVGSIDQSSATGVTIDTNGNIIQKGQASSNYWFVGKSASNAAIYINGATGNVGIGPTGNPTTGFKLYVSGTSYFSGNITTPTGIANNWGDVWSGGGANHPWYGLSLNGPTNNYQVTLSGFYGMTFHTSSGWLVLLNNGNFGVGTVSPSYKLHVEGVAYASSGVFSNGYVSALGQNSSDARLKTNIQNFKATSLIKQLHPKSFEWNDLAKSKFEVFRNTGTQYGLIAQDVKEVMPEWVDDNLIGSGYMGIRYDKLIPVLLQGEIETIGRVETLEDKVKRLETENSKLRAKLSKLERRIR